MPLYVALPSFLLFVIDIVLMMYWTSASYEKQEEWDRGTFTTGMRVWFAFAFVFVFGLGAFGH